MDLLSDLTGFHIEPTNICTLKCPGCSRTRFLKQWPQHWQNQSLNIDTVLDFLDIDLTDKKILLSGNYGDPIYHPDFVEFVKKLKQRKVKIFLITNGSYRTEAWWNDLCALLDSRDCVQFSIDGVPENFTKYRINADWSSIETGIRICVKSQARTEWKYIPFRYNEQCVDHARSLARDLGVDDFVVTPSDRYDEQTVEYMPANHELLGYKFQSKQALNNNQFTQVEVTPRCQMGNQHFISSGGFYTSCCYLSDHRFYYKTLFGKHKDMFDIATTTFSQLVTKSDVVNFYQNIQRYQFCQFNCPKTQNTV
jgi:organic radical activating enzyme